MLYVGVVSDHPETVDLIREVCGSYMGEAKKEMSFFSYENSYVFLLDVENGTRRFDIVFLDTSVRGKNAVEAAQDLRNREDTPEIVFISETSGYCLDAFRLGAVHYLISPVQRKDAEEALHRAMKVIENFWHKKVLFKTVEGYRAVDLSDLEGVVSDDHHQILCLRDGKDVEVRSRMSQVEEKLKYISPFTFISSCRGVLINAEHVAEIREDGVLLKSGRHLPMAKRRWEEFREAYFNYAEKMEN